MGGKRDPKTYRALSEPHENTEAVNDAISGFLADVGELRKKYRLANVTTIVQANALTESGEEGEYMVAHHYGDALRYEPMTAYAYASARKEHEEAIAQILKGRR